MWWQPQLVAAHLSLDYFGFFVALHFLKRFFSVLCCYFAFKEDVFGLRSGDNSITFHSHILSQNSIRGTFETLKEEDARASRGNRLDANGNIVTLTIGLAISCIYFLSSFSFVRFSFVFLVNFKDL